MIDAETARAISQQMYQHWIGPELEARSKAGTLPVDFDIKRCLIRLPVGSPPIVEFNEEVKLSARVKVPDDREVKVGDPAYLHDIERIERVEPPDVDGVRVAFFYAHRIGGMYTVFFDLTPNNSDLPEKAKEWMFGEEIGAALQATLVEQAIDIHESVQADLMGIGLWAAPALLPYPLSKIASLVKEGHQDQARKLLLDYCSPTRLSELVAAWWTVPEFLARRTLFEQALAAHVAGQYCLSISALIPQIEGVMTDWLHANVQDTPWRQESTTKKFKEVTTAQSDTTPAYRRVVESAISFILHGPALATFSRWFDSFDTSFANRHVVGHGKYDDQVYTEENSVKLLLMLDTLYQLIAAFRKQDNVNAPS
jgi:hypothetical protein